jgi:hypothetical protein
MNKKLISGVLTIFILLSAIFYILNNRVPEYQFTVLEAGNALMAALSFITWIIIKKQIAERPQAFIRGVYSATFLKMMVCMISILGYVLLNRTTLHKPSVFILFGIYIVYSILETWLLSQLARGKNNKSA